MLYKYKFNIPLLLLVGILYFALLEYFVFNKLGYSWTELITINKIVFIVLVAISLVVHELLHALAWIIKGKAKIQDIILGILLEKGILYCACCNKTTRNDMMFVLSFPLLILGIAPFILAILFNNTNLLVFSIISFAVALGDIVQMCYIVKLPSGVLFVDKEDMTKMVGFYVISEMDLSGKKGFGISFIGKEQWNEDVKANVKKHIYISKFSIVVIIALIVLAIISCALR